MLKVKKDYLNIRYVASIFFFSFFSANQPVLTISAEVSIFVQASILWSIQFVCAKYYCSF